MKDSLAAPASRSPGAALKSRAAHRWKGWRRDKLLYLMILPGFLYFVAFKYLPMGGLIIAFKDYQPFLGLGGSPWVGLKHFERLFAEPTFLMLLRNTIVAFSLPLRAFPVMELRRSAWNQLRIIAAAAAARRRFRTASQIRAW